MTTGGVALPVQRYSFFFFFFCAYGVCATVVVRDRLRDLSHMLDRCQWSASCACVLARACDSPGSEKSLARDRRRHFLGQRYTAGLSR